MTTPHSVCIGLKWNINIGGPCIQNETQAQLIYIEMRNQSRFQPLERLHGPALLLIAAQVGPTRLIDNFLLQADGRWETGNVQSGTLDHKEVKQDANYV